jgi:hypothetical protein
MLTYISIKNIILRMAKIANLEYTLLEANN